MLLTLEKRHHDCGTRHASRSHCCVLHHCAQAALTEHLDQENYTHSCMLLPQREYHLPLVETLLAGVSAAAAKSSLCYLHTAIVLYKHIDPVST